MEHQDILEKAILAACLTCLVCAILGQVCIRYMKCEERARREGRQQNVVHPV